MVSGLKTMTAFKMQWIDVNLKWHANMRLPAFSSMLRSKENIMIINMHTEFRFLLFSGCASKHLNLPATLEWFQGKISSMHSVSFTLWHSSGACILVPWIGVYSGWAHAGNKATYFRVWWAHKNIYYKLTPCIRSTNGNRGFDIRAPHSRTILIIIYAHCTAVHCRRFCYTYISSCRDDIEMHGYSNSKYR